MPGFASSPEAEDTPLTEVTKSVQQTDKRKHIRAVEASRAILARQKKKQGPCDYQGTRTAKVIIRGPLTIRNPLSNRVPIGSPELVRIDVLNPSLWP